MEKSTQKIVVSDNQSQNLVQNESAESLHTTGLVAISGEFEQTVKKKKKLSRTNYSMLFTHAVNNMASVFVSTFLVSYIYKISPNYVFNIGLFYMMNYIFMAIFYVLASIIVDRSNRVIVYKFALVIRGLFMLSVVIFGENLARYIALAGMLHGFSEGCYWASFNVMKNELVPGSIIKNYSTIQQVLEKFVSVVVPIVLGKLIDANSFKTTAIIVMCIVVVQIFVSFFIKSHRPDNSSFNMKEFFADIKNLGEKKKSFKLLYLATFFYGFTTIITPLNTVLIMFSFNSDFSLGILTSVASVLSMFLLIFINKMIKPGKNRFINIITAVVSPIMALILVFYTNQTTMIIYSLVCPTISVVHAYYLDVYRNTILKKLGLYHDIAEHQCMIELLLCLARVLSFGIMVVAGLVGAMYGVSGLLIVTKILLGVLMFSVTVSNFLFLSVKKCYVKHEII